MVGATAGGSGTTAAEDEAGAFGATAAAGGVGIASDRFRLTAGVTVSVSVCQAS